MKIFFAALFLFIIYVESPINAGNKFASQGKVSGTITDVKTKELIEFAAVAVLNQKDVIIATAVTDSAGNFKFESLPTGIYYLQITFVGYETFKSDIFSINPSQSEKNFGNIKIKQEAATLKEVTVESKQIRVQQNGDTIQYNADAYKTHPDATTEDLVNKMPGVSSDNSGNVTVNGEQVKQVLVDGKPFFGDDPGMALKNLPAEVVSQIQVFDKLSDQAQLTGFDDGNSSKTINIITRPGKNNGEFGKIYGGYGADDAGDNHYIGGGNINLFEGNRRISILGLSNNVNQQNFSSQDLIGVGSGGGGRGGGGGGGQGGGGSANNFLVNQQGGISTTNALGFNYSDNWGKKIKMTSSYFYNQTDNNNSTVLNRDYILTKSIGSNYDETDGSETKNYNNRINARIEYDADSSNSFIIVPKINFQKNNSNASTIGSNLSEDILQSKTTTTNNSNNSAYDYAGSVTYRHKFRKKGRTFSINVSSDFNNKSMNGSLYALNNYYYMNDSILLDQQANQNTNGYMLSSNLAYTEPIDSNSQLQFNYAPSITQTKNDKETNDLDPLNQQYTLLDTALSNKYESTYLTNRGGVSYRRKGKKYNFMAGVNYQYATLSGDQTFPSAFTADRKFNSVLPQAMFNYRFSGGKNLRIIYRASTDAPSVSQLQNIINNQNPLLLSTGNSDLKQDYQHTIICRYGKTNTQKATGLFFYIYGNYTQNYIGNSSIIATKDTILNDKVTLNKGGQLSKPVNLQGYGNVKGFMTYSLPLSKIKCNLNLSTGFTYNRIPALINDEINLANNYNISQGFVFSSNISEKVDFTLSYTGNYSIVKNSLQTTTANNNYISQVTSLKFNWIFWGGFVFNTAVSETQYNGLSQSFNQNYLLCNGSFGYKFLKSRALEVKGTVFDVLKQNTSISRTVTETYIQDSRTNVLTRYYMLMVTYTFRNFQKLKTT